MEIRDYEAVMRRLLIGMEDHEFFVCHGHPPRGQEPTGPLQRWGN